ncbi:hypothetical protein [Lysobacter gummosus]|jgi:hypothetical protein|uniref:Secreted protein n=1 Tax=Lysobacter gummosus TaxID=262324 RepID=A0ABY3XGX9_9GAMM|nr:hypothetical protein [Lysobacter gummosus]ALN90331.1 hypothetical protein LG3211_1355 [Lysobacter gummosus]UNP30866.1 hypothetical protein MOV92_06340 [Lysobacter gummosus]
MRRLLAAMSLILIAGVAQAQSAVNCASLTASRAQPVQPTLIAPIAPELVAPSHQLGAPTGVLSQALDEALSVDQVLLRIRLDGCNVAKATPASSGMPSANDPAAYKPKTEFDNTPWRFDMSQGGKRMTADEFSAWMKAKGVRVAKGSGTAAAAAPAPAVEPAPAPAPADEKKKKK